VAVSGFTSQPANLARWESGSTRSDSLCGLLPGALRVHYGRASARASDRSGMGIWRTGVRWRLSRRQRWVAAVVLWLAVYECWQVFGWPRGERAVVGDVLFYPLDVLAVLAAWSAARRCRARPRLSLGWRLLAATFASYLAGDVAWTVYDVVGAAPYPSVADVFYLAFYPLMLWGLLMFGTARSYAERLRTGLDLAVVAIAGAMLVVYVVLGPTILQGGEDPVQSAISVAYPVGDVVLLVGLALVLVRSCEGSSVRALQFMGAGLACFVAADLIYGYMTLHSSYQSGGPVDSLWMVSLALFAVGGAAQPAPDPSHRKAPVKPRRGVWAPYLAVGLCFGLLLAAHRHDRLLPDLALLIGSILVATLVSMRQFLSQRDLFRAQGHVAHQASHDALTGLPNRTLAINRARELLDRDHPDATIAALAIDIDDFKHVNETFGHAVGDELLLVTASRLSTVVRESDLVARLAADEFLVLLDLADHGHEPELVAERICRAMQEPVQLRGASEQSLSPTVSIGVAVGEPGRSEEMLHDAELALQEARTSGHGRWVALGTELQRAIHQRHAIQLDLKGALADDQFFLDYQPIFDLNTLQIVGAEALLRWRHPDRGTVPPAQFITLAEDSGQIVQIGRWVLHAACRQAATFPQDCRPIGIWVNVSARQLEDDNFVHDVADALTNSGLWPAALTLEITETTLMRDPVCATRRLTEIKALGARIAVDDFGAGHSSLAYLRQFPVDIVKIDRAFITSIATSERTAALTYTLLQLGKTLGLQTLGEGIEDWNQLDRLQHERCDLGQGFLLARPTHPDVITQLLASEQPVSRTDPAPAPTLISTRGQPTHTNSRRTSHPRR
jgi:diguanylate cyclase